MRVGHSNLTSWNPIPIVGLGGTLEWVYSEGDDHLVVGQKLGMAAHWVEEHQTWSLMGEHLFGVGADGEVIFQERHGPYERPPEVDEGLTPDQLFEALADCSVTEEAEARRDSVHFSWGPDDNTRPTKYIAAICRPTEEERMEGICQNNEECGDGMVCSGGMCFEDGPEYQDE